MIISQAIEVPSDDPLARHKTLNYWRKRIAYDRAIEDGADEVLCMTRDRLICEASRSNIFFVQRHRISTPRTEGPLLPGIMRQVVLERARSIGIEVSEEALPIERIATADEAFLTSSVRGIVPLARLIDVEFPAPGPVARELWTDTLHGSSRKVRQKKLDRRPFAASELRGNTPALSGRAENCNRQSELQILHQRTS